MREIMNYLEILSINELGRISKEFYLSKNFKQDELISKI